jgi:hypothetical protein
LEQHYKDAWSNTLDHYNADTQKWNQERQEMQDKVVQLEHNEYLMKRRMYDIASETCDGCVFADWYDGPLCMVSGDYADTSPSTECKRFKEEMKG